MTDWDAMHAARIAAESELDAAKKKVDASAIQAQVNADRVLELAREKDRLMEMLADRAKLKEELAAMTAKVTTLEEGNKLSVAARKGAMDANARTVLQTQGGGSSAGSPGRCSSSGMQCPLAGYPCSSPISPN